MKNRKWKLSQKNFVLMGGAALLSTNAWGWGSYGHQQISDAAITVLEDGPLKACLTRNRTLMLRYVVTPDFDWKMGFKKPTDPDLLKAKEFADHHEHPLHFFEGDTFVVDPAARARGDFSVVPTGSNYRSQLPRFQALLSANASYVVQMDPAKPLLDPSHPSVAEVTSHGTAPWRTLQLYRLGVASLRQGQISDALFYLGTMAHYVGDMSQPFHTALNYDGRSYSRPAAGIHSVYESKILERIAKHAHAALDPQTQVWTDFSQTAPAVVRAARQSLGATPNSLVADQIVPEIVAMSGTGYRFVDPLLNLYANACHAATQHTPQEHALAEALPAGAAAALAASPNATVTAQRPACVVPQSEPGAAHPPGPFVPASVEEQFSAAQMTDPLQPGRTETVLESAEERMGQGTALLSKIWKAAYQEAGTPDLSGCQTYTFNELSAVRKYPVPDYLPTSGVISSTEISED